MQFITTESDVLTYTSTNFFIDKHTAYEYLRQPELGKNFKNAQ